MPTVERCLIVADQLDSALGNSGHQDVGWPERCTWRIARNYSDTWSEHSYFHRGGGVVGREYRASTWGVAGS
ncbi:MAG: hypothetical protein RLZZ201_519, partial [Actinomycetota bacterium]